MSDRGFERGFFRERHTIPGSLYLLLIIILNWNKISEFLKYNSPLLQIDFVSGFALALFGVFGLTITGFVISQIWFLIFWSLRLSGFKILKECNPAHTFLTSIGVKSNLILLQSITDYFGTNSDDKIRAYISRRLDLMHILGSSIISVYGAIITTVLIGNAIESVMWGFLLFLKLGMFISIIMVKKENYQMVDYIVKLEYCNPSKFWNKIPNEYIED